MAFYGLSYAQENSIGYRIADNLQQRGISQESAVLIIAALPIVELRGAIPVAHLMGMKPFKAYLISIAGNMIPVIPIILLLGPLTRWLSKFPGGRKFFDWFFERTRAKASLVEKYKAVGLALFVAIPLPVTGAWTGCAAAFLFKVKPVFAFIAILSGVMIAGIIMSVISVMGWVGFLIAVVVLGVLLARVIFNILKMKSKSAV
ncbi:MAG: small multi-drug export protein [Candidatus Aureabacteria bacterium]|nr:small multi-drug export protein [Candidatus Auribacterota bacterium]